MKKDSYSTIHRWLIVTYGNPKRCSNRSCENKVTRFEWALKNGKEHAKDISNYRGFCSKCHKSYDMKWRNFGKASGIRGTQITTTSEVHKLLKVRAAREGLTFSELLNKLLKLKWLS